MKKNHLLAIIIGLVIGWFLLDKLNYDDEIHYFELDPKTSLEIDQ